MTREELRKLVLSYKHNNTILQLPTGYGKSRVALEILNLRYPEEAKVLIVCPKLVLFQTWKDEINKWFPKNKWNITFTSYISFPKHGINKWDMVIFDECHHITDRVKENFYHELYKYTIYLSATIKKELLWSLKLIYPNNIDIIKLTLKDAIIDDVLPEPTVYLLPLELDNVVPDQIYIKNKHFKKIITCDYRTRAKYWRMPSTQIQVKCTEQQYVNMIDNEIEFFKKLYMNNGVIFQKNRWLKLAGERLKYLSNLKIETIKYLLNILRDKRTITFCADIKQTKELGNFPINSQTKESAKNLDRFNRDKIKHITCCNMLNEGVNLVNCQIGIWSIYNSSSIMIVQKIGRLLRHKEPIIILPYYKDTREEEIVEKMLENFNKDNVKTFDSLNEISI